jgi:DNA polymerase elongation subunit (family B)
MAPAYFYSNQSISKTFQQVNNGATGAQLNNIMVRSYLQEGKSIPKTSPMTKYEGAMSYGYPGIHDDVFKVDVASLYPSIILTYKVYDKEKDPDGKFLQMVQYFTDERLRNKKLAAGGDKYHDDLNQAQKIFINSAYGMMGAPGLNFNSRRCAELITTKGKDVCGTATSWAVDTGKSLVNYDTDSIAFKKGRFISEEERIKDLEELNSLYPDGIRWEDDGYYRKVIVIATKNYVLDDGEKLTFKGSALKDQKKEPALTEMLKEFLSAMLNDRETELQSIYHNYIKEIHNIQDISRWAQKKTISEAVLFGTGTTERKIREAVSQIHTQQGDKVYLYAAIDGGKRKGEKGKLKFYK